MTRAGLLRHRITFQTQSKDGAAAGQRIETWSTFATVWGSVEDVSGRELVRGGVTSGQANTLIKIRHRNDITNGMRAIVGPRSFEIVSPPIDRAGRRRDLEVLCRELTP